MGKMKRTEKAIDWFATFAANSETENNETGPINYYLDDKAIEEFKADRCDLKENTALNYIKEIKTFGEYLNELGLFSPEKDDCDNYLISRRDKISPGSARAVRGTLKLFGRFLVSTERAEYNPWALTDPKELKITVEDSAAHEKRNKGYYTLEEAAEILIAISHKDSAALARLVR